MAHVQIEAIPTGRAKTITESILERAGPIKCQTFLLEIKAFRLVPVSCPARRQNLQITVDDK